MCIFRPIQCFIAGPSLDANSTCAEQLPVAPHDAGNRLISSGSPLGRSARANGRKSLVPCVVEPRRAVGVDTPVVVGDIIPTIARQKLLDSGVTAVNKPNDFELGNNMNDSIGTTKRPWIGVA